MQYLTSLMQKRKIVRTNLTTDKDGKVSASNLRPGDYQFVETKAPKDYDLNNTPIPFTIEKAKQLTFLLLLKTA